MSVASDQSKKAFACEWTSRSFTQIEEFLQEVKSSSAPNDTESQKYKIIPGNEGAYHYIGKVFLTNLKTTSLTAQELLLRMPKGGAHLIRCVEFCHYRCMYGMSLVSSCTKHIKYSNVDIYDFRAISS